MQPTLIEIERLAKQAGKILKTGFGQVHQVTHKGSIDLVTEIDRQSEEYLVSQIHQQFPGQTIIGEEGGTYTGAQSDLVWYLDPLDGTSNFVHGIPIFSVSIAFSVNHAIKLAVVYDPLADECFSAEAGRGARLNGSPIQTAQATQLVDALVATGFPYHVHETGANLDNFANFARSAQGVRRLGSAALDMCFVACGRLDGFWELGLQAWDLAAGVLIAREAGAVVTAPDGSPFILTSPTDVLAANPTLHPQMTAIIREGLHRKKA
ncbi:MAG: hypothetical protein BGO78_14155 [Chloroflexi bacterium 44-23]|nr:MAG: hypothetical protein BGO78_14155 [Chloroflexi bacterium 44-23]